MMKKEYELKNIQGMRAVAICMVFISHTSTFLIENKELISNLSAWGRYGVYIFLAISGVLLASKKRITKYQGTISEGIQYALPKIKKLYWLHLLMWFVVVLLIVSRKEFNYKQVLFSIFNLTLTQSFVPFSGIINSFNGPSWYLSMCVFIWIWTPWFIKKTNDAEKTICKLLSGILLTLAFRSGWIAIARWIIWFVGSHYPIIDVSWFESWLTYYCPLLCMGTYILAFYMRKLTVDCNPNIGAVFLLATFMIMVSLNLRSETLLILAFTILVSVFADTENKIVVFLLQNKVMSYLGNLSSYIFLVHGPVNYWLRDFGDKIPIPFKFFVSLGITLLLSVIFMRTYEKYYDRKGNIFK